MWPFSRRPRARLTVLMPLHRAAPWLDQIRLNLERIPSDARVILSDETFEDGALGGLQETCGSDPRLFFREERHPAGWRGHANRLLAAARTELVSILAQDDTITDGYYEKLIAALDAHPSAGLAFGPLDAVGWKGPDPVRFERPPLVLGRRPPWREALELDRAWNLGIPYRGVIRRRLVAPVPATPGDRYADQIWVFGIALRAHLVEAPTALYIKRYHAANTHMVWRQLEGEDRRLALLAQVRARLRGRPGPRRAAEAELARRFAPAPPDDPVPR